MHSLLFGRRLALIGLAISIVVIIVTISGLGKITPGLGQVILAAGGITAGLATIALVMLASPPPRTPLSVHIVAGAFVSVAAICATLGGIAWGAGIDENATEVPRVSLAAAPLLFAGIVFTAAAAGLLLAQLIPPGRRGLYRAVAIVPVALVLLLAVVPTTSETIGQLALAASNLSLGVIFIAPIGALVAYSVTTDKIRKIQKRAAA